MLCIYWPLIWRRSVIFKFSDPGLFHKPKKGLLWPSLVSTEAAVSIPFDLDLCQPTLPPTQPAGSQSRSPWKRQLPGNSDNHINRMRQQWKVAASSWMQVGKGRADNGSFFINDALSTNTHTHTVSKSNPQFLRLASKNSVQLEG